MVLKKVFIFDEEDDRLAASKEALEQFFPESIIYSEQWDLMDSIEKGEERKLLICRERSAARLLVTNIMGIESDLVPKLVTEDDPRLTIIISSCFTRAQIKATHGFDLDKYEIQSVPKEREPYRDRVRKTLTALPRDNSFHLSPEPCAIPITPKAQDVSGRMPLELARH